MGIKFLNKYLYEKCSKKAITKMHLKKLNGKTIIIDTSIYLYHFLGENALMENMYLLISIMNLYNITPIFIFDGKPPSEKRDLIRKRYQEKREAERKFNEIQRSLSIMTSAQRNKAISEMNILKKQFIRIYDDDIQKVKKLMDAYNITYFNSPNEADDLCVYLVKNGIAWGCMSDDMDMLVYGCNNIIRDLNITNHTARLYNLPDILKELNITYDNFKRVCVISGTDYNVHHQNHQKHQNGQNNIESSSVVTLKNAYVVPSHITFYTAIKLFSRYKQTVKYPTMSFYSWLKHYLKLNIDYAALDKVYNMFCIQNQVHLPVKV